MVLSLLSIFFLQGTVCSIVKDFSSETRKHCVLCCADLNSNAYYRVTTVTLLILKKMIVNMIVIFAWLFVFLNVCTVFSDVLGFCVKTFL